MTSLGVCANCGSTETGELLQPFSEGLRCRDETACEGRVKATQEIVARQLAAVAETRTRRLRPTQEQQLQAQFGLTMSDLELTPVHLRDAALRYTSPKPGQEGRTFIWHTVNQSWQVV